MLLSNYIFLILDSFYFVNIFQYCYSDLVCTPVGFATLFTILSRFMIKPQLQKTTDEEISILRLEVDCLARRSLHVFE